MRAAAHLYSKCAVEGPPSLLQPVLKRQLQALPDQPLAEPKLLQRLSVIEKSGRGGLPARAGEDKVRGTSACTG